MGTIKRNKSREMKSATRTATLKHTVYEGDDIRSRTSDSYRFLLPSANKKVLAPKSSPKKLTVPGDSFATGEN